MEAVESSEAERVVATEIPRISRLVRDFAATVERIVDDNEIGLHILDMGIDLSDDRDEYDPYTRVLDRRRDVRRTQT